MRILRTTTATEANITLIEAISINPNMFSPFYSISSYLHRLLYKVGCVLFITIMKN